MRCLLSKWRVLMVFGDYRITGDCRYGSWCIDKRDGKDSVGAQRWRGVRASEAQELFYDMRNNLARALVRRERTRRARRQNAKKPKGRK